MTRAVINVSTTEYYQRGQARLGDAIAQFGGAPLLCWKTEPVGCKPHSERPYAMKAYAMHEASDDYDLLLWADACILPVRSMEPLWERIERDGYWFSKCGWNNYEWTADSAYPDLFPEIWRTGERSTEAVWSHMRTLNRTIPHVVATAFGINVKHPQGKAFLDEYYRLASETNAFCGPWINSPLPLTNISEPNPRIGNCGPSDVRGHRHDQTAASVIAWRLGFELTSPPDIFAYGKAGDAFDERTILVADGSYV